MLTKNSKHLRDRETSAHDSSPLIEFTPLWKTRVSNYPLYYKKIKISRYICIQEQIIVTSTYVVNVKTVSDLNSLVSFKMSFELEATIRDF